MSEDRVWQFVDTNVLIYAHDTSAGPKHARARELLEELWRTGEGCLSIQVLQEFYVTVTHKVARPLTSQAAAQIIADLSVWQVHRPDAGSVLDAIHLRDAHDLSFWDAMIVTSAMQLGCQVLWSEDLSAGQRYGPVTLRSPF